MKIHVKSLQGDEYNVDIETHELVSELKVRISEKANDLPPARQKLVFKGRTMQDTSPIGEYNLEEGCKVHLIVQKDSPQQYISSQATNVASNSNSNITTTAAASTSTTASSDQSNPPNKQSRFEVILRERLAKHFKPDLVEKIMANLNHEINADIHSSSLDDLERLAKQKLNISNE